MLKVFYLKLKDADTCHPESLFQWFLWNNPEALENLHRDFQHAGSDIVQAFTYNGHREKMRVIGKEELLEPLNRSALKIAKKVALDTPKGIEPNLMAGNISNSNIWNDKDTSQNKEVEKNVF